MKHKSKLNVLRYGYNYCWWKPKGFYKNIKQFFHNVKYGYQRITRGYCDWDVWDLDAYYTQLFHDTLIHLADTTHSYPGRGEFVTPESWDKFLRETAELFYNSVDRSFEENQVYKNKYEDEYVKIIDNIKSVKDFNTKRCSEEELIVNNYLEEDKKMYELRERDLQEALDRIKNHYHELWD